MEATSQGARGAPGRPEDIYPLAGVRVLDLTQMIAGPYCTTLLASMGAEVAKVEAPAHGDDLRHVGRYAGREQHEDYFNATNSGKKSIVLDLKNRTHRAVAHDLAGRADIVVENFAPGTAARLGMSWNDLRPLNPRLLYCSISGFGQEGPYSGRLAMDPIIQAISGVMSVTGYADGGPTQIGAPLADVIAGMFGAYAIVGVLHAVRRDGRGRYLDVSMQAAMLAVLGPRLGGALNAGIAPERIGNQNPMRMPSDVYRTSDGVHIFLMVHHDRIWPPFCRAVGREEWLDDPRFATNRLRCENRAELNRLVAARFAVCSRDEITARLAAERVPHAPVNDYTEAIADPQVAHRGIVQEVVHRTSGKIKVVAPPWLIDGQPVRVGTPPALGADMNEILQDWLGWTPGEIARFRAGDTAPGAA